MNENQYKVSVIVPVYNVEKYLRRCLTSLAAQTLDQIEIIVVNDGSPDQSQLIIDEFIAQYPERIFGFIKPNGGLSDARNYGIMRAHGDYIGFVDSDDFVKPDMFEKMYEKAAADHCDIVNCGYFGIGEVDGSVVSYQRGLVGQFDQSIEENPEILKVTSPYAWNKIFSRQLWEKTGVSFPTGMIFEDICTVYPLYLQADRIGRVHEELYYYMKGRVGGITDTLSTSHMQVLDSLKILNEFYKGKGAFERFYDILLFINQRHLSARLRVLESYPESFQKDYNMKTKEFLAEYFHGVSLELGEEDVESETDLEQDKTPGSSKWRQRLSQCFVRRNHVLFLGNDGFSFDSHLFWLMKECCDLSDYKVYVVSNSIGKHRRLLESYGVEVEFVNAKNEQYSKKLATCQYIFTDSVLPEYFKKRRGQRVVVSGIPFFKMTWGHGSELFQEKIEAIKKLFNLADVILWNESLAQQPEKLQQVYGVSGAVIDRVQEVSLLPTIKQTKMDKKEEITRFAYLPKPLELPGIKGNETIHVRRLKEQLNQLNEMLDSSMELMVRVDPAVRKYFTKVEWEHISVFEEEKEVVEWMSSCSCVITDYSYLEAYARSLGKKVLYYRPWELERKVYYHDTWNDDASSLETLEQLYEKMKVVAKEQGGNGMESKVTVDEKTSFLKALPWF